MKKILLCSLVLGCSGSSFASDLRTRILEVVPTKAGTEAMVFAEAEGRVIWVDSSDRVLVNALEIAKNNNHQVRMDYDEETGNLFGVELLEVEKYSAGLHSQSHTSKFIPTVIASEKVATTIFESLDRSTKWRSQCYNRAHGWAFDMWRDYNVNSMKMFLFFTSRFVEEYKYKWWFHVAPYVIVQTEDGQKEMMMDASFMRRPTELQNWTDYFLKATKPVCPSVTKYSDYRNNQLTQDCYIFRTSMYYRSPRDLELLETSGRQKLEWDHDEISQSRKQAFRNWRAYNP